MGEWYVLATPLAILGVLVLFRFIGCSSFGADDTKVEQAPPPDNRPDYRKTVLADGPGSYWRFEKRLRGASPPRRAAPQPRTARYIGIPQSRVSIHKLTLIKGSG